MYFKKGKFMKSKILALFLALTVGLTLMLSGCGDSKQAADTSSSSVSSAQVTSSEGNKKKDSSEDDFYQPRDQAPQGNFDGELSSGDKKNNNSNNSNNSGLCFRNKKLLDQHFEKHGQEMGFKSAKEYEAAAVKVVNNPKALHKLESDQDKGNTVYYLEKTNEFVVVSADGFIRTYFNPSGGKSYYDRQ